LRWLGQFIVKRRIVGQRERIGHRDHRYDHHCGVDRQHDDYDRHNDWQHVNDHRHDHRDDHRHDDDYGCR
jgi:hypothetical protein